MKRFLTVSCLLTSLLSTTAAHADGFPDYIKGADIEKKELDLQYQYITTTDDEKASKDHKVKQQLEAFYGVDDSWLLLGGAKFSRSNTKRTEINQLYIGAAYQFIEARDYGFNAAFLSEYIQSIDTFSPSVLEGRLLLDKKWGEDKKHKTKANIIFRREIGSRRSGSVDFTTRLSHSYKVTKYFEPAVEWHAGYGEIDKVGSFNADQEHYLGPAIYGEFDTIPGVGEFEYQIAYLPGITDNAGDEAFKFLIEYEINF